MDTADSISMKWVVDVKSHREWIFLFGLCGLDTEAFVRPHLRTQSLKSNEDIIHSWSSGRILFWMLWELMTELSGLSQQTGRLPRAHVRSRGNGLTFWENRLICAARLPCRTTPQLHLRLLRLMCVCARVCLFLLSQWWGEFCLLSSANMSALTPLEGHERSLWVSVGAASWAGSALPCHTAPWSLQQVRWQHPPAPRAKLATLAE